MIDVGIYDYLMIVVYFAFMLVIGFIYRRASKDTSDFIRGGGSMTWWMTGASSFMFSFSAWTFVGCASRIYRTGTMTISLFFINALFSLFLYFFLAHKYRRMRVVTSVEGILRRFGKSNEQFYAWEEVMVQFFLGGVGLYTVSVFVAPVMGINIETCIIVIGAVVTIMSITGGAWAVVSSDFVQMLVLVVVNVLVAVLVLSLPGIGGISGFLEKLPPHQLDWSQYVRPEVSILYILGTILFAFVFTLSLTYGGAKYLYVRSDIDAKKAALFTSIGFFIGPFFWFLPPMAASILLPPEQLAESFPYLNNPSEASYLAMAAMVLPKGMIGLVTCGIFAATMSAMDTTLNRTSGIMVRSIYKPLIRKSAGEKEMLLVTKLFTGFKGTVFIIVGILWASVEDIPLFEYTQLINSLLFLPLMVPITLGFFVKKTPDWSCWSTVLIGVIIGVLMSDRFGFTLFDSSAFAAMMGWDLPLVGQEAFEIRVNLAMIIEITVCSSWFVGTAVFHKFRSEESIKRVDAFFDDLDRPVTSDPSKHLESDKMQYKTLGLLSLVYGGFLAMGVFIPNEMDGRVIWFFSGAIIMAVGAFLYAKYRKMLNQSITGGDGFATRVRRSLH